MLTYVLVGAISDGDTQIEARSQAKFNRYLRAGTVLKYVPFIGTQNFRFLTAFSGTITKFLCCSFACAKFAPIPL